MSTGKAGGRYQLGERIAVGGMAEIFEARHVDRQTDSPIVIKRMLDHLALDPSFRGMFVDEARISTRLDHPNIVRVVDFDASEAGLFLVMEYVDGPDLLLVLSRCAKQGRVLPAALAVYIACHTLEALDYAHSVTADGQPLLIVHRDVSPSNILISRRGQVKLADFGIARAVERQHEIASGTLKGKFGYMSPEQVAGQTLDGRSDCFSVAIVLTEMLTGRRLFTAPTDLDLLTMVRRADLSRLERFGGHIPGALTAILRRALAANRTERYRSAAELRDALSDWLATSSERTSSAKLAEHIADLEREGGALRRPAGPAGTRAGSMPTLSGADTRFARMEVSRIRAAGRAMFGSGNAPPPAAGAPPVRAPTPPPVTVDPPVKVTAVFSSAIRVSHGDLGVTPLTDLLCELTRTRRSGNLRMRSEGRVGEVLFREGHPRLVRSNVPAHRFGEFLRLRGVLSVSQLARAVAALPMFDRRMGRTLVELGFLRPVEAVKLLAEQAEQTVADWCGWPGYYEFSTAEASPPSDLELNISCHELLSRCLDLVPLEVVRGWMSAVPAVLLRGPVNVPEGFAFSASVTTSLARMSPTRSLRDELAATPTASQVELMRAAYVLWRCGVLDAGSRPR